MPTIDELLHEADEARKHGRFDEAERLCREALEIDAGHADALRLLGRLAHARGRYAAAADSISRAIRIEGGKAAYHLDLAEALLPLARLDEADQCVRQALRLQEDLAAAHGMLAVIRIEQRRFDEAVDSCRRAIELEPKLAVAHTTLAQALHELGRRDEAAAACREAIACDPMAAAAHHELGRILQEQGDAQAALDAYGRALAINPQLAEAQHGIGTIFHLRSQLDEAIDCYRRALAMQPNYAQAYCNLGTALKAIGQPTEAAHAYVRAVECDPTMAEAHFNLGVLMHAKGQFDAAAQCYEGAIRARPDYAQAYNNLGTLYAARGQLAQAAQCYEKTLAIEPQSPEALNNLGNVRKAQGRIDEARDCYERSIAAGPGYAQAHYNRSLMLLADGDYATGWKEYEWRLQCPDFAAAALDRPRWHGERLEGRTLLIHAEQGLGDTLQFVRFVPLMVDRGGPVKLEVHPTLVPLLKQSGFAEQLQLVGQDEPPGSFDLHVPLMSLPGMLGITPENIPSAEGYLSADPQRVERWRGELAGGALKVGIAWQGDPTNRRDPYRSIPLERFAALSAVEGVRLFSLQKGPGRDQLADFAGRTAITDLADRIHDFADTAAIMANLDLVISCDSAPAHLAGALGRPVWIAVALVPDWRWMYDRPDSPWYASVRLFRQQQLGDWTELFERMAAELALLKPAD